MLSSKNVFDDSINYDDPRFLSAEDFAQEDKRTRIKGGDVLLTIVGTIGRSVVVPTGAPRITLQRSVAVIRPDSELINSRFLMYSFMFGTDELNARARGVAQKGIYLETIRELEVEYPNLSEQQRIVAILDEAFDGIATAKAIYEANLRNARALFESHLNETFTTSGRGWVERKLGDIVEVQSGGTPLVSQKEYWSGDIPWYSSGELNTMFTVEPERQITIQGLSNSNAKLFPKGSLLVGMYDTAALKMSILDRDAAFNQAVAGVKPNDEIDVEFIFYAINAAKQRLLLERRGVRQKNLSLGKIKDIRIGVPGLNEQRTVVAWLCSVLAETQRLESLYQKKIAALDELKKSMLHQAFSGQL